MLADTLKRFGGVLKSGGHSFDKNEVCALELVAADRGLPWTDDPETLGMVDLRSLNDVATISDRVRTKYLLPVIERYLQVKTDAHKRRIIKRLTTDSGEYYMQLSRETVDLDTKLDCLATYYGDYVEEHPRKYGAICKLWLEAAA